MGTSELSEAAGCVWGKAGNLEDATWLPLWRHLDDTAGIAAHLWDAWLPAHSRRLISADLPSDDDGRTLTKWLAGVHDLGKISPAFSIQLRRVRGRAAAAPLVDAMVSRGFDFGDQAYVWQERSNYRHELASFRAVEDELLARGWSVANARALAVVVGGHHGRPPRQDQPDYSRRHPELLGTGLWHEVRREYFERSLDMCNVTERLDRWREVHLSAPVQAALTACVIMADWIASGMDQWERGECEVDDLRVRRAIDQLRLPSPWRAEQADVLATFAESFGLHREASPRPLQREVVRLAETMGEPGLMIVEAPMGEGKTEAALLAARVVAARFGIGGLFVALPTRATASAIFARMTTWLRSMGEVSVDGPASVMLVHGKASLDDTYVGFPRFGVSDVDDVTDADKGTVLGVHRWMVGRKKAMLATFAVGTIDQVLFAALRSKHVVLRHLALANKAVVIDEAHSYDVFMSTYLDRALEWLGGYRIPVIVLSATLPSNRRREMVAAYERGRAARPGQRSRLASRDLVSLEGDIGYPVVVSSDGSVPIVHRIPKSERSLRVYIEAMADDDEAVVQALKEGLVGGGAAVVIRNTVRRVQSTASAIRDAFPDAVVIVAHSRFVDAHRRDLDQRLLDLFGRPGSAERCSRQYIVIASQVLEQSLDVDFDLMITDVAPIDLLLQRIGRLHRHDRGNSRPAALLQPRCLITGVDDWTAEPPIVERGCRSVYSPYVLYRSLSQLDMSQTVRQVVLPQDIAKLVQAAYEPGGFVPKAWAEVVDRELARHEKALSDKRDRAKFMRVDGPHIEDVVGWLDISSDDADEDSARGRAQVRDTAENLTAIVLIRRSNGTYVTLPAIDRDSKRQVPTDSPIGYGFAKSIASCSVGLPLSLTHEGIVDQVIAELELNKIDSFGSQGLLEGELVLALDSNFTTQLAGHAVQYSLTDGLIVSPLPDAVR